METHVKLGASLYVPATRDDIVEIGNRKKHPDQRSVIFCTEDSVRLEDLDKACANIRNALPHLKPTPMLRFIRVRSVHVLGMMLQCPGINKIDGFVLPKITEKNVLSYLDSFSPRDKFHVMPTLETEEIFSHGKMYELKEILTSKSEYRKRILSLRIGGNDLMHLLGIRKPHGKTIYETSVGSAISNLVQIFKPSGFNLTAPVFEGLNQPETLEREVQQDLDHGLFGKTAVHPTQVRIIERAYKVSREDYEMASAILEKDAPAVFRMHDLMCEPATHTKWARNIMDRESVYGLKNEEHSNVHHLNALAAS